MLQGLCIRKIKSSVSTYDAQRSDIQVRQLIKKTSNKLTNWEAKVCGNIPIEMRQSLDFEGNYIISSQTKFEQKKQNSSVDRGLFDPIPLASIGLKLEIPFVKIKVSIVQFAFHLDT